MNSKESGSTNPNTADNKAAANNADLVWEPVSCEHIISDNWIDFRRMAYRMPDG